MYPYHGDFQTKLFLDHFSNNFDWLISLTNTSTKTGDKKIAFLMFSKHLLFLFVIIVLWMPMHTERARPFERIK